MNSSKNIIAVTALSVILMASLIWLAKSDGQAWIFTASASAASPDSVVLLPEAMTASNPADRERLILLARRAIENETCPSWLKSIQQDAGELAQSCSGETPAQPAVQYGAAFDDGSRALLQIRFCHTSGQRVSACVEFAMAKSGWQLGSMRYRRQNHDNQRISLATLE